MNEYFSRLSGRNQEEDFAPIEITPTKVLLLKITSLVKDIV